MAEEKWAVYMSWRSETPALVSVDLALTDEAPWAELPWRIEVCVRIRAPDANGMHAADEGKALDDLSDRVEARLAGVGARRVAQRTGGGRKTFVWHAARREGVDAAVADAAEDRAVDVTCTVAEDRAWAVVRGSYAPNEREMHSIRNQWIRDTLRERYGDTGATPRDVRHFAYFADETSREGAAIALAGLGFRIDGRSTVTDDASTRDRPLVLHFSRQDAVTTESAERFTDEAFDACTDAGGEYDGWEAAVVEPPAQAAPPARKGLLRRMFG